MKSVPEVLNCVAGIDVETAESDNGWRAYRVPDRGEILILDARQDMPQTDAACARFVPDVALLLKEPEDDPSALDLAAGRLSACSKETPLIGIAFGGNNSARLAALLNGRRDFSTHKITICAPENGDSVPEAIAGGCPTSPGWNSPASPVRKKRRPRSRGWLLKSSAVCGVIGLQPIPLADMPILTTLQTLMVGLIIYTTGKPVTARIFGEFSALWD